MPTVPDIHRRGTRAAQASATLLTVGTLWHVSDEGVTERWNGSGWESYSGTGTGAPPPPTTGSTPSTWLVSGGQVVWESAYTFRVSSAEYYINGSRYTSSEQTVTLVAAHASLDRIDAIVLNTSGVASALTGTAAATPSEPTVDPAQYLKLAIVFVQAATTVPPNLASLTLFTEHAGPPAEWTWSSSGGSIVVGSTTNPHAGTKCIEGTSVIAGVFAQGQTATAFDPTVYDHLLLFLRSKATWNNARGLLVSFRLSGVLVGATVQVRSSGTFGFDSSITSAYQMVAIPLVAFSVPQGSSVNQVRVEDYGGSIGFFLDDISLQATGTGQVNEGMTQEQADARYAPLVHVPRHQAGGADPLKLDDLAQPDDTTDLDASTTRHGLLRKLPNDATKFLDGTGVFATPVVPLAAHHATHEAAGSDAIKLDDLAAPDDTTDLNASAAAHGLLRKLSGNATQYLDGVGTWSTPAGGGGTPAAHHASHETGGTDAIVALDAAVLTSGVLAAARLPARIGAIGLVIDGGGSPITTGVKGFLRVPFTCVITAVTLLSTDASATAGSIVVDIWKDTYASYPPTVADTITASAKPTLASANKSEDTTLTGWTTTIAAGDVLGFNVNSAATVTRVALLLTVQAS